MVGDSEESYLSAPGSNAKYGATDGQNRGHQHRNDRLATDDDDSDHSDSDSDSDDSDSDDDEETGQKRRHFTDTGMQDGQEKNENKTKNKHSKSKPKASYKLLINDPSFLAEDGAEYPDNIIISSKYTVFTFLP